MGAKPKARKTPRKAKNKHARAGAAVAEKSQSERFIEAARSIGVDESGKEFDRALERLTPPKIAAKAKAK